MKPSARFKRRYVSFSLAVQGSPPTPSEAKSIVHEHFLSFFGEIGIASLAFKLVKYDGKNGVGILRCARDSVDETVFCMACLHDRNGVAARLEPLATSGSVRRASPSITFSSPPRPRGI